METARDALAALEGVAVGYSDQIGTERLAPPDTIAAILAAMGHDPSGDFGEALRAEEAQRTARRLPEVAPVPLGAAPDLVPEAGWVITFEDGTETEGRGALPALPLGRHRLQAGGETCWLLSAPPSLPRPARGWGVVLPLYGLRGEARGGIGDFCDLRQAVEVFGGKGAGFVGINPIHAGFPTDPSAISPYSPSHRRRLSVMHLHSDAHGDTPGELIDYAAGLAARRASLERQFETVCDDAAFEAYLASEGESLRRFAIYETLAEHHGPTWDRWPPALQKADAPEVAAFAAKHAPRIRFHSWLQYFAEAQLSAVEDAAAARGMAQGLYLDLAVGTHPHGAETWADPGPFAFGVSLGAPPDAFSESGQVWNVAPFNPRALVATGFEALAATLRAQLRHAGMLRIDHILGFERAFWVPDALPGTYVSMPRAAMLAVVRIEAARAGAVMVGEDLGNIPKGLQGDLQASGILGTRVAMFEKGRPAADYPETVLTAFGTHDLPTWAGWRQARDLEARRRIGAMAAADDAWLADERKAEVARLDAVLGPEPQGADAIHRHLAETPSCLVALQIEDILEVDDQPNLPGTVDAYPNWRRQLPVGVDRFGAEPRIDRAAEIMARAGRAGGEETGGV